MTWDSGSSICVVMLMLSVEVSMKLMIASDSFPGGTHSFWPPRWLAATGRVHLDSGVIAAIVAEGKLLTHNPQPKVGAN